MHVILTHEQADFDAIAAQLGATLLHEGACPVLPHRLNRNVRAFLTLYGAELPFYEARDLPSAAIRAVTLVDTQSLITLKGMGRHTQVQVVDHHQARADVPEGWSLSLDQVGACTTLFVEALRERELPLTQIQATLLMLGIYEDSGSLTYASTTARDVRAVAYLMEQGANLRIAVRYLNPPLSAEQRQLYDALLAAIETHEIHSQKIILSCARAEEMSDEISSVAHKLRDLLDPDALFLLVRTSDGIRLVARSSTDRVDVSAVAAHFGGGGHDRAASALVRLSHFSTTSGQAADPLALLRHNLLEVLPRHIRPAITVEKIMSRHPLVLSPATTVHAAAQLMQRYGYEGYPIIDQGKVVGLLTRRAVDRALSHKLNLTAGSLMEAGEICVQPQDSLEHLQRIMIETGWGQIPVVSPGPGGAPGAVIGIVTRTDLLKTLTESAPLPGRHNLASQLENALPAARLALLKRIAAQAREQHQAIYVVGGVVRDLLLERPCLDFDLVIEGDAIALARSLQGQYGGSLVCHSRFGTAKWTLDAGRLLPALLPEIPPAFDLAEQPELDLPDSLDLISARTEFYDYPTALPTIERSSIKLDLHRRDFTMNTMAVRLDGRHYGDLYDYWGGLRDLRQGVVRVLHSLSFVDDPTRLLRAVRFEQRFDFHIEARTIQLMDEALPLLRQVSGDRLRHELNLILDEKKAPAMLARLDEMQLLNAIHPALAWNPQCDTALNHVLLEELDETWFTPAPTGLGNVPLRRLLAYLVWLTPYPVDTALAVCQRLRLAAHSQQTIAAAARLWHELPALLICPPSQLTAWLDAVPVPGIYAMDRLNPAPELRERLAAYIHQYRHIWPVTNGASLQARGLPPGPMYARLLTRLRSAWLNGEVHSAQEESTLLEHLLASPDELNQENEPNT